MFVELLADSVARAVFWLLIIFGAGFTVRFLLRDIINYMMEDDGKGPPE